MAIAQLADRPDRRFGSNRGEVFDERGRSTRLTTKGHERDAALSEPELPELPGARAADGRRAWESLGDVLGKAFEVELRRGEIEDDLRIEVCPARREIVGRRPFTSAQLGDPDGPVHRSPGYTPRVPTPTRSPPGTGRRRFA